MQFVCTCVRVLEMFYFQFGNVLFPIWKCYISGFFRRLATANNKRG